MSTVGGWVDPGFERVRDEFESNLESRGELGAAFCVYRHGRPIIDLWGGVADPRIGRPWNEDTITIIYSATKAITAICSLMLIDEGTIELDAPVAKYWPEFAANGKSEITIRQVLSHRAGIPCFDRVVTVDDMARWDPIVEQIAALAPIWEPGTCHGYHTITFGWILGEVIRRVTGMTPGKFLRNRIAPQLGLDMWIGLPEEEESRYAPVVAPVEAEPYPDEGYMEFIRQARALVPVSGRALLLAEKTMNKLMESSLRRPVERALAWTLQRRKLTLTQKSFVAVLVSNNDMNSRKVHALEMPAGNGICTARSLARLYASLVGEVEGIRLISDDLLKEVITPASSGADRIVLFDSVFGLGFMLPGGLIFDGWKRRTFGHPGMGGSLGFADVDEGLSVGYILNGLVPRPRGERLAALVEALYRCLDVNLQAAALPFPSAEHERKRSESRRLSAAKDY